VQQLSRCRYVHSEQVICPLGKITEAIRLRKVDQHVDWAWQVDIRPIPAQIDLDGLDLWNGDRGLMCYTPNGPTQLDAQFGNVSA
jgi:hypothetical protein